MKNSLKYQNYTVEDFLSDEDFQDWIIHPNPENENFWEEFQEKFPEKEEILIQAKELLLNISFKEHLPKKEAISQGLEESLNQIGNKKRRFSIRRYWWLSAAAVILVLVVWYGIVLLAPKFNENPESYLAKQYLFQNSKPGGNKAILTLANGEQLKLDTAAIGQLARQGNSRITKLNNGMLTYQKMGEQVPIVFNTLRTPRGGQYQITLTDGTKVWLNAESSISYPSTFKGNRRKVKMKGEAYFEVAQDEKRPFFVEVGDMEVKVLGTCFNVKAYEDESNVKTTLLNGVVKVSVGNESIRLKPGQQAVVNTMTHHLTSNDDVNPNNITAWKNGLFVFKNRPIQTVMQQVSRWYDVDVVYDHPPTEKFFVDVSMSTPLSSLLKMLESTNSVHFKWKDKTIIVTQ